MGLRIYGITELPMCVCKRARCLPGRWRCQFCELEMQPMCKCGRARCRPRQRTCHLCHRECMKRYRKK